MPEIVTNELLYEVLKNLQERMSRMEGDLGTIKARQTSQDYKLGLIHIEIAAFRDNRLNLNDRDY